MERRSHKFTKTASNCRHISRISIKYYYYIKVEQRHKLVGFTSLKIRVIRERRISRVRLQFLCPLVVIYSIVKSKIVSCVSSSK